VRYIRRDIEKIILEASKYYTAILVTGTRQAGKTTTLQKISNSTRKYVTLDDLEARSIAQTDPELFLSIYPPPILIVQRPTPQGCRIVAPNSTND
jgi:predicted AAA+ superfamily ATPase